MKKTLVSTDLKPLQKLQFVHSPLFKRRHDTLHPQKPEFEVAKQWPLALCMICRLEKFQMPPGRGRILLDLSKAECEIWHTCTVT